MNDADVSAYIGRWRPSSVSPQGAAFARAVIAKTEPAGRERAKNLLWAAGKLADYGTGLGLEAVPEVLLHPSVTERFTRCAPGLSPVARRTLRTNLRFTGRRVVPQLYPADVPLPRERSKQPYGAAEVGGFLALADAQPTRERRMRAAALVCLGAGAGLIRGWCRIMGLAPRLLFTTCLIITRNQRITTAWDRRQEDSTRRAAAGLPPRTRRRRRKTLATLAAAPP